ncbi:Sodium channel protein Nach [Sesbania bispinosa]|nr:Sodium channel protein Nach [Sesbania bispinosa]
MRSKKQNSHCRTHLNKEATLSVLSPRNRKLALLRVHTAGEGRMQVVQVLQAKLAQHCSWCFTVKVERRATPSRRLTTSRERKRTKK